MLPYIKNFVPPPDSVPYNPSKKINVPAGNSVEIALQGRGANAFGITRIIPYGSDLSVIEANFSIGDEYIVMKEIQLSVVRQLFLQSSLRSPLIIEKNNTLYVTLTNTSGTDQEVNVELIGYDTPALNKLIGDYEKAGIKMPVPIFLFAKGEVLASANNQLVNIPTKSSDIDLVRMAAKSDNDPDITLTLQLKNEAVKNQVFIQQLNDEFLTGPSLVPLRVGKNSAFAFKASNSDGVNDRTVSFLGEGYIYKS